MLTLSCALAYTYIVATKSAYMTGTDVKNAERLLTEYGGSPLKYSDNARALASVVFLWPGMCFTFLSTWLLWHSLAHIDDFGPKSTHARKADEALDEKTTSLEMGRMEGEAAKMQMQPPPTYMVSESAADQGAAVRV